MFTFFTAGIVYVAMAFQSVLRPDVAVRVQTFEPPIPLGISKGLWRRRIQVDNPLTQAKVSLGETLYLF